MWNDVKSNKSGDSETSDIKWADLQQGTHQFRVLSEEPYSRWTHWVQTANEGKGCTIECLGKDCPMCKKMKEDKASGEKPKINSRKLHALNVLQRKLNEAGKQVPGDIGDHVVIDKGNGIFESLVDIMGEMGDLRGYDIKIKVTGKGMDTNYTVIPLAPKALTKEEQAIELIDFANTFTKLAPEKAIQMMNGASYKDVMADEVAQEASVDATVKQETTEDELEVDFNAKK